MQPVSWIRERKHSVYGILKQNNTPVGVSIKNGEEVIDQRIQ